jgi:DnaJ-class molecular chaperone
VREPIKRAKAILPCLACGSDGVTDRLDVDLYMSCGQCRGFGEVEENADACDTCGHVYSDPRERCQCELAEPAEPQELRIAA